MQNAMFFGDPQVALGPDFVESTLSNCDFSCEHEYECGSSAIADLATKFSSCGMKFDYDPSKCEMWTKPSALTAWLTTAKAHGYNKARLVMHGSKSDTYAKMRDSPLGLDMHFSDYGAQGYGLYVACSDHIPTTYNDGCPNGTAVIGLLLIKGGFNTEADFVRYQLQGSASRLYRHSARGYQDAYCIRNVHLFLPLGLAVAK